jgi:hypothetical protein
LGTCTTSKFSISFSGKTIQHPPSSKKEKKNPQKTKTELFPGEEPG